MVYNGIANAIGGTLTPLYNPAVSPDSGIIALSWTDNTGVGDAQANDLLSVLIFNSTRNESLYMEDVCERGEGSVELETPSAWSGDTAQVYLMVHRDNTWSDSVYMGSVNL